ncbi:MAG: 4Fe-4S dicluster domain-containing protein [Clostridia bacterium]|nr:4Fe-4S dicluster domain-containing protein [Clostridia bacterium]
MQEMIKSKLAELLSTGAVTKVIGWKRGENFYDVSPAAFESVESLADFVYDDFCGANLSKFLVKEPGKESKVAVVLKPCDTFSLNQLIKENRVNRENIFVLGVPCEGKLSEEKMRVMGIVGLTGCKVEGDKVTVETLYGTETLDKNDVLLTKCATCHSKKHVIFDELIGETGEDSDVDRFVGVAELEAMSEDERYEFWRNELSRCIRCNACRNACPACTCEKCVFDNDASGVAAKSNANSFEENMFHIIRAYHVAGRCTDCGECSRVCPQHIPLHLLNRKFIKDINTFYGDFQAGADAESEHPLVHFTENDPEPSIVKEGK